MTSQTSTFAAFLLALASTQLGACSNKDEIQAEPSTGGGGAGGVGGGGASGGTTGTPGCPKAVAGADLVLLPSSTGKSYCMDAREVLNSEYKAFLDANPTPPAQPAECAWNTQLTPEIWHEGDDSPPDNKCPEGEWRVDSAPDLAVSCVDFCDAYAYCKWAGKRLCGEQGKAGDKVDVLPTPDDLHKVAISTKSEWFDACTQGGKTAYPYGDAFEAGRCIDVTKYTSAGTAALNTKNLNGDTCAGSTAPFDAVHHLSGNVYEWANLCTDGGVTCKFNGGSYGSQPEELACAYPGIGYAGTINVYVGFRCCADAVTR